ncbi:diaminopimelate epimerase [Bacillaceae bacterium S4-13-58]
MMNIPFTKMHGLGNSYIYIDVFSFDKLDEKDYSHLAQDVSSIYTGIGSDGLILIMPSEKADVRMRIFNKDGSEGKNCGNGLRCVAKYAFENNIVSKESFQIETLAGVVQATVHVQDSIVKEVTVNMGKPRLTRAIIPMIGPESEEVINEKFEIGENHLNITAVSMGNPHAVFFVDDIDQAPLYDIGAKVSLDPRFPEGVNAEFVEVVQPDEINFRVYERGSGVTQACGTGACAAAIASILNGFSHRNKDITVHLAGGDLIIKWDLDGQVWMTGAATTVAKGNYQWYPNR